MAGRAEGQAELWGEIHLLPALPKAWADGEVSGLRARGGFTVDEVWSAGRLVSATIRSARGGPCVVRAHARLVADGEPNLAVERPADTVLRFPTKPGGVYRLVPEAPAK